MTLMWPRCTCAATTMPACPIHGKHVGRVQATDTTVEAAPGRAKSQRVMTTGHECAQAGCDQDATHVVVETHSLALVARGGACLVCGHHATAMEAVGGAACSLERFIRAAAEEHPDG